MSHLKRFSIDTLKIDQSFVKDIPEDANGRALASMIIAMAHVSRIRVIAEGVERSEQLSFLRDEGCDEIQGFLFSEPVPADQIARMCHYDARPGGDPPTLAGQAHGESRPHPGVH